MITRSRQVALVLTAVLAAGAACQARDRDSSGRSAPPAAGAGFTLVASGDVLPHDSVIDRAAFDGGRTGHDFRPLLAGVRPVVSGADMALCHMETCRPDSRGR
jgi:poly-gamma-glutamate synthesis protein (capsule biosynthesis protein)